MKPRLRWCAGIFSLAVALSAVLGVIALVPSPSAAPSDYLPLPWFFLNLAFAPLLIK